MSTPLYSKDGIYTSPRPPISLPQDPEISMVPFLFRNFSSIAQTTALIDSETGQILTFSNLKKQVSKLSTALLNLKISKNYVVFIFSQNSILFPISFLAVVGIGAIATTANPQYTTGEVTKQAEDSNPKLIITTHELYHKIMHLNLPCIILSPKTSVHITANPNIQIWYLSDLIESLDSSELLPFPSVLQTDVAALLYSSGTTGTSKEVVITHRNFIATSLMVTSDQEVYCDPKNVFLCFLPLYHIFCLAVVLYAQLQRGNAVAVMAKYEMEKMLMAIEKYKVAHMFVAPPVVIELAKRPEVVKKYDVSSLKEIGSGAAPLGKEVMEGCDKIVTKKFSEAVIYQVSRRLVENFSLFFFLPTV